MNPSANLRPHALAFIYEHLEDFAVWIRRLTPGQIENMAEVLIAWHATVNSSTEIVPLSEIEKREITRAVSLCGGDLNAAAQALRIGRTTLYRKMRHWGYSAANRRVMHQAYALANLAAQNESGEGQKSNVRAVDTSGSDNVSQPTNRNNPTPAH